MHNLVENHGSDDETRPINSDEAEEITEVIEGLQRETEKASGLHCELEWNFCVGFLWEGLHVTHMVFAYHWTS